MLADMQTETAAAHALTWQATSTIAAGEDAFHEIPMAKLKASETYVSVAAMGMQISAALATARNSI